MKMSLWNMQPSSFKYLIFARCQFLNNPHLVLKVTKILKLITFGE